MSLEYIRYRIPKDGAEQFEDAYRRAAEHLATAEQCVDYELSRCEEDPESYVLRITWTSTRDHLESFRGSETFRAFFAEISPYLRDIEEMRHYQPTGVVGRGAAVPSLYDWAGGAEAFDRLFSVFYQNVLEDPELEPLFRNMHPEHPHFVALWLGEVFGGPPAYSAERGGHAHMIGRHVGKRITEVQRRRWMRLLIEAADEIGMPEDPDFRAAFVGYLEWGTRLAVYFSGRDTAPRRPGPMPTWTWTQPPPRPRSA